MEREQIRDDFMQKIELLKKMKRCNHVFIKYRNRNKIAYNLFLEECIKCGFNKDNSYKSYNSYGDETISIYAAKDNFNGLDLDITYPIEEVRKIYSEILMKYPEIEEEKAISLLKTIIEAKVKEENIARRV